MEYINKIIVITLLMILVTTVSVYAQQTTYSDQEIGFDENRIGERLIERGIPKDQLDQQLEQLRQEYLMLHIEDQKAATEEILTVSAAKSTAFVAKSAGVCNVSEADRQTLIELCTSLKSNGSCIWPTEQPVCGWRGVTVNALGEIIEINLPSTALDGTIPESIKNLTQLKRLNLKRNSIKLPFPNGLWELSNLEFLDLSGNRMEGAFPQGITNLTSLKYLNLTDNSKLLGGLPNDIGNLQNLERLELYFCGISGEIPLSLWSLTKLTRLSLNSNRSLTGEIPVEIGNLTNLEHLGLGDCGFEGEILSKITGLTNLRTLELQDNNFSGTIPTNIDALQNLIDLRLNTNKFSGQIPEQIGNLSNLSRLNFILNDFSGTIPSSITGLTNLRYLSMGGDFDGGIPVFLGQMNNLLSLSLYYCGFEGTIPSEIGDMTTLTQLYISGNPLSGRVPGSFSNLTNLFRLTLVNNGLEGKIPQIYFKEPLPAHSSFNISNNKFVFSDFENDYDRYVNYSNQIPHLSFSPQADLDEEESASILIGESYNMQVTGLSSPDNQYQWYKGEEPIAGATEPTYVIKSAITEDSGVYHCKITNTKVDLLILKRKPITLTVNAINPTFLKDCDTCKSFKPLAGAYTISGWVKEDLPEQVENYTNTAIVVNLTDNTNTLSTERFTPSGNIIDGWQRITGKLILSDDTIHLGLDLVNGNGSGGAIAYFDDIRIHPFNGNMKSFVYDPKTQRLMAELDENNYATFYEYDQEGGLIRVKKETEKGVYTIQETRSSSAKKQ